MRLLIILLLGVVYTDSKQVYTTVQMMDQVMVLDAESLQVEDSILTEFSYTVNCSELSNDMDCNMVDGCDWMMGMCMESSSQSCMDYSVEMECNMAGGCEWTMDMCMESSSQSCMDYSMEMECNMADGCEWMMGMCMESTGNNTMNTPHFIVLDETNGYWFVTTIASGFVVQYSLIDNSLIGSYFVGDAPALLSVDPINKKVYCSRMMPMNGMGNMMPTAESNIIQGLNYSSMGLFESENQEYNINSPAPHGLAINDDGTELYTASNTADWLYKINTETHEITGTVMDSAIDNTPDQTTQRLKPIQCLSVGNRLFISCSAGLWYNSLTGEQVLIEGSLQMWNSESMQLIDEINLGQYSSPWHIVSSPIDDLIYVVLGGDNLYDTEGVASVRYSNDNLQLDWKSAPSNLGLDTLHGIDISSDGSTLYVSGRGDGNIHVFNALDGSYIFSNSLGSNSMLGGLAVEKKGIPALGDLNNDTIFNILDITNLINIIFEPMSGHPYSMYASDLSGDQIINIFDVVGLIELALDSN